MQNKGAIRLLAILLALVSIYQLSFTFFTKRVEKEAVKYSKGDPKKEKIFLDSISGETVYNFLWLKKFTYKDCKEREVNLGLDLKGGMNVTLEVSLIDVIRSLANYSPDPTFNKALVLATKYQLTSRVDYVTLFGKAFHDIDPNAKLASIFSTVELKDVINYNSTDEEVMTFLKKETANAIDNTYNILRNRIDRFGVAQPNIQRLQTTGRILVELPGVKEPERVRKLLQGTASLEFWETFDNQEIYQTLLAVNKKIKELKKTQEARMDSISGIGNKIETAGKKLAGKKVAKKDTSASLLDSLKKNEKDSTGKDSSKTNPENVKRDYPLFSVLTPNTTRDGQLQKGAAIGISHFKDTTKVNAYFRIPQIKELLPRNLKMLWTVKPIDKAGNYFQLIAIKVNSRDNKAPLEGNVVTDARAEYSQTGSNAEVAMGMNSEGAKIWARLTKENVGKQIAIVLDDYVYSYPVVQSEIKGGRSSITGNFTIAEAKDLANVLKSGKLPAPAKIIEESVVGPSLGKEAIHAGLLSFILALIGVLLYMSLYYNGAGHVADIALFANVFFLFGVLASIGAVLTLPGVAGIVLTLAMAVDSNVIIYERMREEFRAGKGLQLVVKDGFWHAYSAIIDGHVTTILTGIVLFLFGSGPIQGFATTLIIGLILSLFSSIFIARLLFEWMLTRRMNITLGNRITINAFTKTKIPFIEIRKTMYVLSGIVIGIGIISLFVRGLSYGIDFTGGRTYVVRFDKDVRTSDVRESLAKVMGEAPEVKTFGPNNQVKITTNYLMKQETINSDSLVEVKLYDGVKQFYRTPISYENFVSHTDNKLLGRLSSQKVGPTIALDLIRQAFLAVFFGLIIIFIYITFRFKDWQFGLGGVISLAHDSMVVITMFTLFHGILPFSLEVDQSFIAAILTVIGYSIMDTVIIFDRIREYRGLHPKWDLKTNIDLAINSTLGRTINTSGITIVVLLIIFIFGGEVLRGFIFALLVGVVVGTYSSVFNATPVAYDIIEWRRRRQERLKNK
ncbi:MAG: protein translocase subunit SecDF [Bacteroidia bacterium]|nr:protein translocase subunit SecDF [Bacteroidia bacterium]